MTESVLGEIAIRIAFGSVVSDVGGIILSGCHEIRKIGAKRGNCRNSTGSWRQARIAGIHILDGCAADRDNGKAAVVGCRVCTLERNPGNHDLRSHDGSPDRGTERDGDQIAGLANGTDRGRLRTTHVGHGEGSRRTQSGRSRAITGWKERRDRVRSSGTEAGPGIGHEHARIVGENGGMRRIHTHGGLADVGIPGDVDLQGRTGVQGNIGADAKNRVEIRRIGRSRAGRNDYGAIDLTTRNLQQSRQRDRCHPAHTSETHRHPEEEVLIRRITFE